jgi:hypothetical protein
MFEEVGVIMDSLCLGTRGIHTEVCQRMNIQLLSASRHLVHRCECATAHYTKASTTKRYQKRHTAGADMPEFVYMALLIGIQKEIVFTMMVCRISSRPVGTSRTKHYDLPSTAVVIMLAARCATTIYRLEFDFEDMRRVPGGNKDKHTHLAFEGQGEKLLMQYLEHDCQELPRGDL